MARRIARITITAAGRDQGKVFVITEMAASQAERWAMRAFLALAAGGAQIPDSVAQSGLAGVAALGLSMLGRMRPEDAQELMAEMFACVQFQPSPAKPEVVRGLIEDDIEEVATRVQLRKEVFALHVDFSQVAALFGRGAAAQPPAA